MRSLPLLFGFAGLLGMPAIGHAQETAAFPSDSTRAIHRELEEVIITAEKKDVSSIKTPIAVSVIKSEALQQDSRIDLQSLSGMSPNFYMQESGMKLSTPIYMRGIGTTSGMPPVGLYVDGVPIFDKNAYVFDLYDVRQIEILRGPQSTLYGRNSINGLINIATQKPKSTFAASGKAGVSSFNTQNYHLLLHLPISSKVRNKVAGSYTKSDGYVTNDFDHSKSANSISYDLRYQGEVRTGANTNLTFGVNYNRSEEGGYAYHAIDSLKKAPYHVDYNTPMKYNRDLLTNYVNLKHYGENASFNSITSYSLTKDRQNLDADFTYLDVFDNFKKSKQHQATQEFVYRRQWDNLEWTMGFFGFYKDLRNDYIAHFGRDKNYLLPMPLDSAVYKNNTDTYGAALYTQLDYTFGNGFKASAGIRYDYEVAKLEYRDKVKFEYSNYTPLHDEKDKSKFKAFLPKVALQKQFTGNTYLYATVAKGYKAGGYNVIANDMINSSIDLSYGAEELWNYELGTKMMNNRRTLQVGGSLFYTDWKNQQIFVMQMMGPAIKNAGDARSYGAELELQWAISSQFAFNLASGYADARYTHHENSDYVDNYIVMAPRFTFFSGLTWNKSFHGNQPITLTAHTNVKGFGKQYFDEANTLEQNGYFTWNASVKTDYKAFSLEVWGKNLLDKHYYSYMFTSPIGEKRPVYQASGQSGIPARFGASLYINL